ncbi:tetratricopeptide repeat protein [Spartinivicinus poritis]|uniref:Tetratricopeptide repeat protein n=1 Tax=Spartinivicinus poritis TaxID=2994640 RepID=A0ABT5UA54_9GAMM|nr:tetratricopeptide repeat protein [Spartinivicinus sp. A2-2]MDE1463240.1 tetratricopeptide repeat protein [Spartinivicinus sp. A2-2]
MSCWETLGIEPTGDLKQIKRAYATKLKQLDLATQQMLFEELRGALETAKLKAQAGLLDQPQSIEAEPLAAELSESGPLEKESLETDRNQKDEPPALVAQQDDFLTQLEVLYADFPRRIQLEEWQQLLANLPDWTLDKKLHISEVLFAFLLENYYLPTNILAYLEKQFDWYEQYLQLIKQYDEADVRRLFALVRQPLGFPGFEFLQDLPSNKADHYIELRWAGRQALVNHNTDKVFEYLLQAYDLYKQDPYLLRLLGNAFERVDRFDKALDCYYAGFELTNEDYDFLLRIGHLEQRKQNWEAASRAFMAALNINPEQLAARKGLIECVLHCELDKETLDDIYCSLSQLIEQNPLDIQLLFLLAKKEQVARQNQLSATFSTYYWLILAKAQIYQQDFAEAAQSIEQAEKLDKTDKEQQQLLAAKANLFVSQQQYQEALPILRQLSGNRFVTANIFYQLAFCLLAVEEEDSHTCLPFINQAIKLDPNNIDYYAARGKYYYDTDQYEKSAQEYLQVVAQEDNNSVYWFRLGYSQYQLGQYQQAMNSYRHCVEIDETNQSARVEIFACYLALGENQTVLAELQVFLKNNPEHIRALWLQAETYRYSGMINEAMAAYRHGFNQYQISDMGAWLAYLLLKTKQYFLARKILKQLAEYKDHAFWSYLQLGLLALHFNKKIKGFYYLNQAFEIAEQEQLVYAYGAYFLRGISLYYNGDKLAAVNSFKQALAKEPDCAMSYAYLSIIQRDVGLQDEASHSIEQALALEPQNSPRKQWLEILAYAIKDQVNQLTWSVKWKYFGLFRHKPSALIASKVILPFPPQLVDKPQVGGDTWHPSELAEHKQMQDAAAQISDE